jgi:hypothetical protein
VSFTKITDSVTESVIIDVCHFWHTAQNFRGFGAKMAPLCKKISYKSLVCAEVAHRWCVPKWHTEKLK